MNSTQERALAALYTAAGKKVGVVVDIRKARLAADPKAIDTLLKRGYIARSTATSFSVTLAGLAKLAENRRAF